MNSEERRIEFNAATNSAATTTMLALCGSPNWVAQMCAARPFASTEQLHATADTIFESLEANDWLAAFSHHPKIGNMASLKAKYAGNDAWSGGEQAGIDAANEETLLALAKGNEDYEARFDYIFIVCASGKPAREMLQLLQARLGNDPDVELAIAADEQRKITHLRLDKWLNGA